MTPDHSDTTARGGLAPARRTLSPIRHAGGPVRIFGLDAGPSVFVPPQPAGWVQLVTVRSGAAAVTTAASRTIVVPGSGLRLAADTPYTLELRTRCELRIVYAGAAASDGLPRGSVVLTPLLGELIERLTARGYLDERSARDAHLLTVIHDELRALALAPGTRMVPLARTAAIRAALEAWAAAPDGHHSTPMLAAALGMSVRSLERHVLAQTGLTPRTWLRRARLAAAAAELAAGASVTQAGLAAGYASLSAFIAAYRSMYGSTPGRERRRAAPS